LFRCWPDTTFAASDGRIYNGGGPIATVAARAISRQDTAGTRQECKNKE
jgi:hypothetical protein